jgi:hypothetical protein
MAHPTNPTPTEKPKKVLGADSTERVLDALTRAAADVLMRSKLPAAKRGEIAASMTELGTQFSQLAASAWGEPG